MSQLFASEQLTYNIILVSVYSIVIDNFIDYTPYSYHKILTVFPVLYIIFL